MNEIAHIKLIRSSLIREREQVEKAIKFFDGLIITLEEGRVLSSRYAELREITERKLMVDSGLQRAQEEAKQAIRDERFGRFIYIDGQQIRIEGNES